jgi:hypothetical protein
MNATDFGDPDQILHIPGRDLRALFLSALAFWAAPAGAQTLTDDTAAAPPIAQTGKATADDPWRAVDFGVTLESFYQYNWNRPPDRSIPLRAYDSRANSFAVQQAALVVDMLPDVDAGRRFGLRADLQFGMATETVQGNPANEPRPEAYRNLWQAYGSYVFPIGRGLQTDVGKFASNLGFETNYAKDNNHFSRAYLFNFLPFYHSGLRVTYPVSDQLSLMYMLTNGIQQTEDFNDFKSSHVTAIVKPLPVLSWTVNYYVGQEQPDGGAPDGPDGFFRVFDTYVSYTATPALSLGIDLNYVTNEVVKGGPSMSLQGLGAYARYQVTPPAALAVRYERLDDEGLFGGVEQVLHEVTATVEHKLADGFLVRGEFRRDWSNERFFPGPYAGDLRTHQNTALIGLVWWFGNKQGAW